MIGYQWSLNHPTKLSLYHPTNKLTKLSLPNCRLPNFQPPNCQLPNCHLTQCQFNNPAKLWLYRTTLWDFHVLQNSLLEFFPFEYSMACIVCPISYGQVYVTEITFISGALFLMLSLWLFLLSVVAKEAKLHDHHVQEHRRVLQQQVCMLHH